MLRKRNRTHRVPELNTTSTADISFMLLVFFLVTTSMETDKGIARQMPPLPDGKEQTVAEVKRRNVLVIGIDAADSLTCNGCRVEAGELKGRVMEFIDNKADSHDMPERTWKDIPLLGRCRISADHLIFIRADRAATYSAYFAVQDAVTAAYNTLRDRLAVQRFGHRYAECSAEQQEAVRSYYPMRLSEGDIEGEGGTR